MVAIVSVRLAVAALIAVIAGLWCLHRKLMGWGWVFCGMSFFASVDASMLAYLSYRQFHHPAPLIAREVTDLPPRPVCWTGIGNRNPCKKI